LNISVFLNSGAGTLAPAVNYNTPVNGPPDSVAVGDFDGDGKLDIAAAISGINATSIAIFLGNGDGSFQPFLNIPSGFHSSATLRIATADFDNDGKADIAVTDGITLSILLGSGGAAFRTPVTYLVGPGAGINGTLVVGDFNGDGKPDLATTSRDGVAVFINNGDGTFPAAPITYSPFLGGAIAAGDFDGNGLPDLVTADSSQDSTTTDTVAVLINTSRVSVTVTSSPITGVSVTVDNPLVVEVCVTPCTFNLVPGTGMFLDSFNYFPSPGVGYVVSSWSDGGANPHTAVIPPTAVTYTVNMQALYALSAVASPASGGSITLPVPDGVDSFGNPFFKASRVVPISAAANPGFSFTGWTGPVADATNASTTVTMTGPITVTANFAVSTIAVPNVLGDTQTDASTAITGAGLTVGTITSSPSSTVAAGLVISESPIAGTAVAPGSPVNLVISTGPAPVPTVVSFSVLFGGQSYNVIGSPRVRLPWQITGIRVVFSEPITSGGTASLSGAAPTGVSGLGTNTLTWTITPIPLGNVPVVLAGSGPNALKDAGGNALNSGSGFTQGLKILWGDFNDDGSVSAADMVLVNNAASQPYNIFADINGDGVVNSADVLAVRARAGTSLP
jgi:uncharacterized repeat protein (TIGR02543 family)